MKVDKKDRPITRRKAIVTLLGTIGIVSFGFTIFNYMKNFKKFFKSKFFKDGRFININSVDVMQEGTNFDTLKRWLFDKKNTFPKRKFNFNADKILPNKSNKLRIMWTCHSSVYIEINGKCFFCDPVWSNRLSPVGVGGPKRFFKPPLDISNIPKLDGVIISHDHMDHMDKKIIKHLSNTGVPFYVPIGVDYLLKSWGVPKNQIFSTDWYDTIKIEDSIKLTSLPTIHFSGRGLFDKNKSQWTSWIIEGGAKKIYFGGDSGYHNKFKEYGEKYGPFDITLLEIGAYDKNWKNIHLGPENAIKAHKELNGKVLLPIHWGAYDLSIHPWKEPVEKVLTAAIKNNVKLCLPTPGQLLKENELVLNSKWWEHA